MITIPKQSIRSICVRTDCLFDCLLVCMYDVLSTTGASFYSMTTSRAGRRGWTRSSRGFRTVIAVNVVIVAVVSGQQQQQPVAVIMSSGNVGAPRAAKFRVSEASVSTRAMPTTTKGGTRA